MDVPLPAAALSPPPAQATELHVPSVPTWVRFGRHLELVCHGMVWAVVGLVFAG